MSHATTRRPVQRWRDGRRAGSRPDALAVEEPLQLLVDGAPHSVAMRTPGHDLELALGLLVSQGIVTAPGDVRRAAHCPDAGRTPDGEPTYNVVEVNLGLAAAARAARLAPAQPREVSSACGVCGTERIADLRAHSPFDLTADGAPLDPAVLAGLPHRLRAAQRGFAATGGLHAAGLFTTAGELLCLREDVGRHNAVDKVLGWALTRELLPLRERVLQVSGRASFELVQKAWLGGCPALAAVSAPSSLAVDLAAEAGMTLIGFSRDGGFNVYAGAGRIRP